MNEVKKCSSGKNSYETQREAERAADLGMYLSKEKNLKLKTYLCLQCYQYHLTSSQKRKKK